MAKGFKHGVGGSPLNFKVVAYATEEDRKAATPKENIVGVVTKNKITSWIFAFDKPTEPVEGMVWFAVEFNSIAKFNALKKNAIQVYPIYAQQYVNVAWLDVSAMFYQGGDWVKWVADLMLYSYGNKYEDITGGFTTYCSGGGAVSLGESQIGISVTAQLDSTSAFVYTAKKIDLTHYTTLRLMSGGLNAIMQESGPYAPAVFISESPPRSISGIAARYFDSSGEYTLDISSLTGEYHVCIGWVPPNNYNCRGAGTVYEIKLTR